MGCSCVNKREETDLNTGFSAEISKIFKTNEKLKFTLIRIQSRLRGLLVRQKMRNIIRPKKFMPNDSSNKYTLISSNKITERNS